MTAWKTSIYLLFASLGITIMSILVRMPELKESIGVNTAQLGIVLLGTSIGSLPAVVNAGRVIERFGTRPVIIWAFFAMALGFILIGLAIYAGSAVALFFSLVAMGFFMATSDVAVNMDGVQIEQKIGRSIMPRLHASFSLGAFLGVSLGTLATNLQVPILLQIVVLATATAALPLAVGRFIPAGNGKHEHHQSEKPKVREALFKNRRILWLALGILGITIAEGASNDWLVLSFVQGYGVTRTQAGAAFACLTIAMTLARFFGTNLVDRFGRHKALRGFALVGMFGILLVILGHNLWLGYLGSAMWGVGVALGFPLFISSAGEGQNAARRVSFVTSFGYAAFLVGPPLLGFIGQSVGLLNMFYVLVALTAASAYFASATKPSAADKSGLEV